MKRLSLFCTAAGLLLGSNSPPPLPVPATPPDPVVAAAVVAAEETLIPAPPPTAVEAEPAPTLVPPRKPKPRPVRKISAQTPPADGRLRVVVSLDEQKAYVLRGGTLVASSPVPTGKRGHETPTGTFRILLKKVHHRSSKYDNAPMPYMQRLTSYGIALHAGRLPGYAASHGCIRLPSSFARKLYEMTDHGTAVTVMRGRPRLSKTTGRRA